MKLLFLVLLPPLLLHEDALAQSPLSLIPDQAALAEGNNAFAADLYGQLRKQNGNLFFSPESIGAAFAMAYAGARGTTATEMAAVLHFTLPSEQLHPAMGALLDRLNAAHTGYQLGVADALWAEKDFTFLDAFLNLTATDYGAGFQRVDFKTAPEAARATIDKWVARKTEDKITQLIGPGVLTPSTRLVLTNAIYFKGAWQTPFNKQATKVEDFQLSATTSVKAPLMHLTGRFNYFDGGTFQAVELPYKSGDLSMIVLLPGDAGGLGALEQSMTSVGLKQWLSKLDAGSKVILTLPSFKMNQQFQLAGTLGVMGMEQAFHANTADFSGITGARNLWISAAIHKAFVDVNEEGTEAAAATGIVMLGMAMRKEPPPVEFRADHPFVFLIRDNRTGSILFMGRVEDPTK